MTGLGIAFAALGTFVIAGNWLLIARYAVTGKHASMVPLVGGVLLMAGLFQSPWRARWWAPLVVDPGCASILTAGVFFFIRRRRRARNVDGRLN